MWGALQLLIHRVRKWFFSFLRPSKRNAVGARLLQHLTPRLWEFEGQEAACCQGPRGKEDGHGFGDSNEGGEDADSQDGCQLTESVEEAESRGSENRQEESKHSSWEIWQQKGKLGEAKSKGQRLRGGRSEAALEDKKTTDSNSPEISPGRLPLIRGVKLHRQHVQGIPGGDADSSKQAEQSNHGRLAVAKGQEETADAGDDAGAGWREEEARGGGGEETGVKRIFAKLTTAFYFYCRAAEETRGCHGWLGSSLKAAMTKTSHHPLISSTQTLACELGTNRGVERWRSRRKHVCRAQNLISVCCRWMRKHRDEINNLNLQHVCQLIPAIRWPGETWSIWREGWSKPTSEESVDSFLISFS